MLFSTIDFTTFNHLAPIVQKVQSDITLSLQNHCNKLLKFRKFSIALISPGELARTNWHLNIHISSQGPVAPIQTGILIHKITFNYMNNFQQIIKQVFAN